MPPDPRSAETTTHAAPPGVRLVRRLLRSPPLYFALLGAALFLIDGALRRSRESVTVTSAVTKEVTAELTGALGRPPSDAEVAEALTQWVDEEVLYREARRLGLDQHDAVVRAHLARKLRHMVRERTVLAAPTEAELEAQERAAPARYLGPQTFALTHVFLRDPGASSVPPERVKRVLEQLGAGAEPASAGDHFPRGPRFEGMTEPQLEQALGVRLVGQLDAARVGAWQVLTSKRGYHLVRLDAIASGKPSPEALRKALTADLDETKKERAVREYSDELREKYHAPHRP